MNKKLQQARLDRHWSMAMAAKYVGVSRITYSRWENEEQIPHESTLVLICKAFKMSPAQLGFGPEQKHEKKAFAEGALTVPEAGSALDVETVLAFLWHSYRCSFQELQAQVTDAMDHLEKNAGAAHLSRRDMLSFLIGIPAAVAGSTLIGRSNSASSISADEILPLYATGVPACWKLYYDGGWQQAKDILPTYISQLTVLVQSSTKNQKMAANLLSQIHQLSVFVSLEEENFGASLAHCNQAFVYGKLAEDPNLQAASLMRRSDFYFLRGLPTLEINRQAVKYAEDGWISPLLQSRLYSDWAACLADNGQRQDALRYQGMAQDGFPDDPTSDPTFAYTLQHRYAIFFNESLIRLRLNEPKEAFKAVSQAGRYLPEIGLVTHMELLKQLMLASMSLNDLEQSFAHLESMRSTANQLESIFWRTELQRLAQQLRMKWPQEKRVKQLQEAVLFDGEMT
ncbi:MAG TPA: helix-turn-helix domain-containing protein [Ktedonobacteraceae bacterium]